MSPTNTIVWVHGDCLSPDAPSFQAYPDAPSIWVWDEELLQSYDISLKRIVFMYEALLELPTHIRRGDVAAEVTAFAAEHKATRVATTHSPSPRFGGICRRLRDVGLQVEVHPIPPLIDYDGRLDLKRFSRYWRTARKYV